MYFRTGIAMAPYYTRRLSAEATDHCTRTPGQQTEKPKLPEERNVPKRYIVDRPQRPLCTAVMRWRCQRSGIGRGTATLLGIRPLVLGPKSIQNFCAYRGLAEESVSGHAAVSHQHGRHTQDVKTTHCDMERRFRWQIDGHVCHGQWIRHF